jgi:peptide/nickel transport system substrate-binding protein
MTRRAIDAKWLVAVLTLLALVAAGCSGADSPEAGDDPDGESTAVDDGSASDGGTRLRSAISEWGSESFDPVLIAASSAWEILTPMYDSLLHIDLEGNVAPGVAESWEVADDLRSVTFRIREGMQFHNGEDLTAEDVRYSLLRWYDPELNALALPVFDSYIDDPEAAFTVVDDYTLRVDTVGPADIFIENVSLQQVGDAYILPMDYIEDEGYENFLENPVGTGPWQFKEHRQGDSILYERADGEHPYRETPAFEELEIILVPEEATRLAMLETGEVDIIALSPENVERVESMDCCRIGEAENTIQAHMFFQGTWDEAASPLNDVRVREALSLAIDREELVEQFMHGFGTPIPGAVPGEFFPGMAGGLDFDHFGGDLYDPERAQQLLDEAGVEPGDLHIPIWTFDMSGAPWLHSLGEVFLGYWEPLGVTGEIRPTDLATFIGMAELDQLDERTSGTFAAFRRRIGFEIGQAVAGLDPRETPGGSMIGPPEGGHIPNVVDRVVETLEAEGDERAELGMALMGEASELYVMPGLFYASALWGVGNRAGEWTPTQRSQTLGQVYETVQPAQ